ncbi:atypical kinase COQ8B, mitochondrial-like isoform X3 [Oratosquilla oratoria]|uniref:atypical kinase COQ8B, mitochondrial-like isoform X3 n=1 Tax=Oratosquilla oratoria TaxID=337810 RepID=UPI003F77799F
MLRNKKLAKNAQARKVPHSRIGRLMTFGGLAASLGAGTVAEMTRRTLGYRDGKGSGSLLDASPFLTEANAKRIVDTLCRVRGAALKLGQMLSIQDNALINPQLQKIFERARQSADFMPAWQLENALVKEFGPDWRTRVSSFDDHPFAAASIGQVHLATLEDGRQVAMKIQYPGVADGIESDINNLISTLRVANILPEAWECDYEREYRCTKRFKELVQPYPEFYVPEVIDELSTKQVSPFTLQNRHQQLQSVQNRAGQRLKKHCLTTQ